MPRGKRTVFFGTCTNDGCGQRIATIRLHKQNSKQVGWKDHKRRKYCPGCMVHVDVKLKEERHSK
jgi:hypothetical protein